MADAPRTLSVSRVIAAPAAEIFDILADPSKHHLIDGSGSVGDSRSGPERLQLGSKFGMNMKLGIPYIISNKVVEFEENKVLTWAHYGKHRWRYELEEVEGGTKVTETFDWSTAAIPKMIELMGWPKRHPANMEKTLERLDALVTEA